MPLFENEEIGVLYLDQDDRRRAFEERHMRRLQLLGNLVAAKLTQARTRNEMQLAGFIQGSLLPRNAPPPQGYEVTFHLDPFELVGGDFYDVRALPNERYLIALGDVVGHGVPAALIMSNTLATLRALAPLARTPLALVERTTHLLREQLRPSS